MQILCGSGKAPSIPKKFTFKHPPIAGEMEAEKQPKNSPIFVNLQQIYTQINPGGLAGVEPKNSSR